MKSIIHYIQHDLIGMQNQYSVPEQSYCMVIISLLQYVQGYMPMFFSFLLSRRLDRLS